MVAPHLQVSRDAADALREFSDEFRSALVLEEPSDWASQFGLTRNTSALRTTFPIPLDAAGYKELKGDIKFRRLYARSLSMTSKEWSDGVEEKAAIIEAPDFIDWAGAPANMAREWKRLPNEMVAAMLESGSGNGPLLDLYRDPDTNTASTRRLFAADHPFNLLDASYGTFDNDIDVKLSEIASGAFFEVITEYFRNIKGPNGKPLGLRAADFLVPTVLDWTFKKALEQDTLIRSVDAAGAVNPGASAVAAVVQNNLHKGTLKYTVADELSELGDAVKVGAVFYALAAGRPGLVPWVVQQESSPEEFLHDKSSELYKRSRMVAVAYVGNANAAAALPHGIVKCTIIAEG